MNNFDILNSDFQSEHFEDTVIILVIYDISDNKSRTKLSKYLCGYGYRVQKSAFECLLTKEKYNRLLKEIPRYCKEQDSIRIYRHYSNTNVIVIGNAESESIRNTYFI